MTLNIFLLGQFKAQSGDLPLTLPSRPAQSLLAYLALNQGIAHRREMLAGMLWPDSTESNARNYLRQALWRIRKALEEGSLAWEHYLEINKISVCFNPDSDLWLDAGQVLRKEKEPTIEHLIDSLEHYKGELLPGFYEDWISVERDRLQARYHQKIHMLVKSLVEDSSWDQVLHWGEHWVRHGHAPEAAFRVLMQGHAHLGDLDSVRSTFRRCTESLQSELGVEPSQETQRLFNQIMEERHSRQAQRSTTPQDVKITLPDFLEKYRESILEEPFFVAREQELKRLMEHLHEVLKGKSRVIFVTGEAGSGKTTLLDQFSRLALAADPALVVAGGNCNAHTGPGDPYLPLREILGQLTGDVEARLQAGAITHEHAVRLWKMIPYTIPVILDSGIDLIDTLVSGSALLNRARACTSANKDWLINLEDLISRKSGTSILPGPQQSDLFEQYNRVLRGFTQTCPIVLILDDLQWADPGSIGMLFHLGRQLTGTRILIIGSYRMEDVAAGRDGERHPLEPVVNEFQRLFGENAISLSQSDRRHFVDALLDSEPNHLKPAFRDMLFRHTQGHPLFTIELLRGMQERGDLTLEEGKWTEGPELDWETVPARVEAVIAERIGRLPESLHNVLRVASVEGETFTNEVIARVLDQDARDLLPRLSGELDKKHRLIKAESIQRLDGQLLSSYRFRNILFQKFLYSSLDGVERVHTHERLAHVLESLSAEVDDYPDVVLQLARHFEQARMTERAIEYLHQAGDKAIAIPACSEGIVHLRKGLELLGTLPHTSEREEKELEMQLSIGRAWKYEGPIPTAQQAINRARELCVKLGRTDELSRVLGELSIFHYVIAKYIESIQFATDALALAIEADDPVLQVEAHWLLGFQKVSIAEYNEALAHLVKVASFYKPEEHHENLVKLRGVDAGLSAMAYQAVCLQLLGYPDQAMQLGSKAIELARKFDHPFTLSDVLCFAGCMLNELRDDGEALQEAATALRQLTHEKQLDGWLGHSKRYKGAAEYISGNLGPAIEIIQEGIATSERTNEILYKAVTLSSLAKAQADLDMVDEGLESLEEALKVVEATGERIWEPEIYRIRGEIHILIGELDRAEENFHTAIKLSKTQQARFWELRATTSLARLWQEQGKTRQAKQMLVEIFGWFTEGFETRDLLEAKALLDELQG